MNAADLIDGIKISEGARNFERAMEPARRQRKCFRRLPQKRNAGRIWHGGLFQKLPSTFGVGADVFDAETQIALTLTFARRGHAGADFGAAFKRRREDEICRRDRRHFDLQINAIE